MSDLVRWREIKLMGRVDVELELVNNVDRILADAGVLNPQSIRREKLTGTVDTGATDLVLPGWVVSKLGLPKTGTMTVRFADGRRAERDVVGQIELTLLGRKMLTDAVVEPNRQDALVGVIVLEKLDLLVDPKEQKVYPRDPSGVVAVIE